MFPKIPESGPIPAGLLRVGRFHRPNQNVIPGGQVMDPEVTRILERTGETLNAAALHIDFEGIPESAMDEGDASSVWRPDGPFPELGENPNV